ADGDLADPGEHVELGQEVVGEPVDARGVAGDHGVVPAAAAGPAGVDTHLTAGDLQVLAPLVKELGGERAGAYARRVRLDHAQRVRDLRGPDAGSHAGAPGGRVGGGDERVGAVVHVEHGRLPALHEDRIPALEGLPEQQRGVGDHGPQAAGVREEVLNHLLDLDGATIVDLHQDLVLEVQRALDLLPQDGLVKDVLDPDPDARDLVRVGGADPAAGGADGLLAEEALGHLVELLVV